MKTYGVGVYGIGWVAGAHIDAMLQNPQLKIAALGSRRKESAEKKNEEIGGKAKIVTSFEEMLKMDDVDIIDITTPNVLHAEETIAAAEAGKHVIIEKPIAMNFKELVAIKKAIKKAGIKSQAGFASRWNPHIESLRGMIDKGGLGDLFFVEVDYYHEIGPWWSGYNWGANTRKGGPSATLAAGCHAVDLLRYFGGDVKEVFAYGCFGHRKDYEYEPTYVAVVQFENGKIGKTGNSFENECPYVMNIILHGSKGSVFNEKFYSKEWFPGQETWQTFSSEMLESGDVKHHPFKGMMDDLVDVLNNGGECRNGIDSAYKSHELCLAIDRSIETGEKIPIPLKE